MDRHSYGFMNPSVGSTRDSSFCYFTPGAGAFSAALV
jgi:hypothetical protein